MLRIPFVRITRPANSLAVGGLVLASCLVAGASTPSTVFVAVLGSVLLAAGGYVLNDVFDYETDVIVHQERVLPQGRMSRRTATAYALILLVGSPLLFLLVNHLSFANASLASVLLFLYSWKLKSTSGIVGNLLTSLLASNGALLGGFVAGNLGGVLSLAVCVLFATISREILKDIEDLPGDARTRAQTVPSLVGQKKASWLAALALCLAILATYLPYLQGVLGKFYLLTASAVNTAALGTVLRLLLNPGKGIDMSQRLVKAEMYLYILVFLSAALSRTIWSV